MIPFIHRNISLIEKVMSFLFISCRWFMYTKGEAMSQKLSFTFEELHTMKIQDVDVYVAKGVSPNLDCQVLGYPPAGFVHENSLGVTILSIEAVKVINNLLEQGKEDQVKKYIMEGKQRVDRYTKALLSNIKPYTC